MSDHMFEIYFASNKLNCVRNHLESSNESGEYDEIIVYLREIYSQLFNSLSAVSDPHLTSHGFGKDIICKKGGYL